MNRNSKLLYGMRVAGAYLLSEAKVLNRLEIAILNSRSSLSKSSGALVRASYLLRAQHTRPISDPTVRAY